MGLKKQASHLRLMEIKVVQFMLYLCCYYCFKAALWKARMQATACCLAHNDSYFFCRW